MRKQAVPQFVESTAAQVSAELGRRGVSPTQRVVVAIEPDDWIAAGRTHARPLVQADGWTDADIDRIIEEERVSVQPPTE